MAFAWATDADPASDSIYIELLNIGHLLHAGAGADANGAAARQAARRAAFAWATDATFGRSGCGAPKVLADIVESLTGAVFLDCDK